MIQRIILVDMDNTLCDWEGAFEEAMRQHHPDVPLVPRSQRTSWNHVDDYPPEYRPIVNRVCGIPGFFETMKENPGGIQALKDMVAEGNDVKIVSAPHPDYYAQCCAEKCKWVAKHLGEEWLARLVLTPDKTLMQGHVLIDDKPTCRTAGTISPNWRHVVFSQTYNQDCDGPRLESWKEWRTSLPAKIPLSIANKETLYPNGINFSCVFPSFNQYEIVRKTLAGLAKQKIRSDFQFECIIVDNNSTDDVQQIYMDYRDKLDLRLIQRRKLENTFSVPSARNMGILEAKYDFIGTLFGM